MPPVLATLLSATLSGITGRLVRVEVDVAPGLPGFTIVGLPDAALSEARERVRGALRNAGYHHPPRRITVNLAPAEVRKAGASLDLAIAIGILLGSEQLRAAPGRVALIGELGLGGEVRAGARRCCRWAWRSSQRACAGSWSRRRRSRRRGSSPGSTSWASRRVAEAAEAVRAPRDPTARPGAAARARTGWPEQRGRWPSRRGRTELGAPGRRARRGGPRGRARARRSRGARSRSRWPAVTRCCWSGRRAPARRCWRGRSPGCCRTSTTRRRWPPRSWPPSRAGSPFERWCAARPCARRTTPCPTPAWSVAARACRPGR